MAIKIINGMPAHLYWQKMRENRKPLKRTAIKKKWPKKKKVIFGLKDWYFDKINQCTWICEECGADVFSADPDFQFACQAHLLPKEHFPSIAIHPKNHKCLGAPCGCHRKYDKNWASAVRMKVWPDAEEIILTVLVPLLPQKEYKKLPDFMKEKYESQHSQEV